VPSCLHRAAGGHATLPREKFGRSEHSVAGYKLDVTDEDGVLDGRAVSEEEEERRGKGSQLFGGQGRRGVQGIVRRLTDSGAVSHCGVDAMLHVMISPESRVQKA